MCVQKRLRRLEKPASLSPTFERTVRHKYSSTLQLRKFRLYLCTQFSKRWAGWGGPDKIPSFCRHSSCGRVRVSSQARRSVIAEYKSRLAARQEVVKRLAPREQLLG